MSNNSNNLTPENDLSGDTLPDGSKIDVTHEKQTTLTDLTDRIGEIPKKENNSGKQEGFL